MAELQRANAKYGGGFRPSNEALGTLRQKFLEVEEELRATKMLDGVLLDQKSIERSRVLKIELIQLGAMCFKAAYTFCDLDQK